VTSTNSQSMKFGNSKISSKPNCKLSCVSDFCRVSVLFRTHCWKCGRTPTFSLHCTIAQEKDSHHVEIHETIEALVKSRPCTFRRDHKKRIFILILQNGRRRRRSGLFCSDCELVLLYATPSISIVYVY
jgi:hypothetical protein